MLLKGRKYHFRSVGFADWFVDFKRYSLVKSCTKTVLKINWPLKTP